ncbi:Uncharacterised protein [Klebsiella michiganensis]|uniref:Uncharacterized protein n=1 Tax=Klebsiella michiganensis TaxID=1134687 RepID=A0A7H4N599_9ENTR|nr:Uncharacterised protein [Klebsiella michiganensis]
MNTTSQERMSVREHVAYGSGDMALSVSIISASLLIYTFMISVVGLTPIGCGMGTPRRAFDRCHYRSCDGVVVR